MTITSVAEVDQPIQAVLAEYVTQNEAARLLNLNPAALRSRVHRGSIASVHAGSAILVPRAEIERVQRTYMPAEDNQ
jgi:hypothetical protein